MGETRKVEELLADDRRGDEMVRMMGIYSGVNIQQCVKKNNGFQFGKNNLQMHTQAVFFHIHVSLQEGDPGRMVT